MRKSVSSIDSPAPWQKKDCLDCPASRQEAVINMEPFLHIPMHKEATKRGRPGYSLADPAVTYLRNVHGHIHQNKSWEPWMKCVSVEQTNYTPVHIEELFV